MKTFRIIGSVFFVFGFFFALLGILASVFPLIDNEQIKLILNSFQQTSADSLTNTLNTIVLFCLRSSYFLFFCGITLMVAGGLISSTAKKRQSNAESEPEFQPASPPAAETLGDPKPAYYPGGLEPAPMNLNFDAQDREAVPADPQLDTEAEPQETDAGATLAAGPISGGVELSFTSDESDAEKLMQHDQQLMETRQPKAEEQPEIPAEPAPAPAPEHRKYVSNTDTAEPPIEPAETPSGDPQRKPRIVSTMGKRRL